MSELFLKIINMSISASWLVLVVLAFRFLFRKTPKWVNVLLWGIVAVRLICPFAIESSVSLVPDSVGNGELVSEWADGYIDDIDIHHPGSVYYDAAVGAGREPISDGEGGYYVVTKHDQLGEPDTIENTVIPILSVIWVSGVILLAIYTAVSYWRLQRRVSEAVILRENIFQSENVGSPFVLGIIKPRIYLPYHMDQETLCHVIAHEQAHIRRRDHWWKPLGFLLLTIHWFNPIMWLAYVLLCRDIELACDESVIRELGHEQRADYTQALVSCSVNRRRIAACPLAFGEVGVKERVKSVMNYRKPAFWVVVLSIVACAVVAVCFLTDPQKITIYDIFDQDGYSVISQEEVDITLYVEKSKLPDSIYTAEGHTFQPNEVLAYSTETSRIYLHKAMVSNESDDLLYLIFDCSYDLPESGSFVSPYQYAAESDSTQSTLHLQSNDLRDSSTTYPDALDMRGHGPGSQFAFYVSKEACMAAEGTLMIDVTCNQIEYAKSGHGYDSQQASGSQVRNPWVQEYIPGADGIIGNVDKEAYESISEDFTIGADRYGRAVFKDPYKAFDTFLVLYADGIALIQEQNDLKPISPKNYSAYKKLGWQVTSGLVEAQKQAAFVTKFLDLYENSFAEEVPSPSKEIPTTAPSSIIDIIDPTKKEGFSYDAAMEKFFEDEVYDYFFGGIYSQHVIVHYADGTTEDIVTALNSGKASIADLDRFGIPYWAEPKVDPLDAAIRSAIIEVNRHPKDPDGLYHCASFVLLQQVELSFDSDPPKPNEVTVYGIALHQSFSFSGGALLDAGGSHIPVAITFEVENGKYNLKEYWRPGDGSYYVSDIRDKFPDEIEEKALDTQKYIRAQIQNCYAQAVEFGGVDTTTAIEELFTIIESSPLHSSNPGDYINEHSIEYRELTYYGQYTLRYCFEQFLQGNQTGLRGHLMRAVIDDIAPESKLQIQTMTGQEYFDAWKDAALRIAEEHSAEWIKGNRPAVWVLLQMMGEYVIEFDKVSALVSEKGYTGEDFKEELLGQFNENIIHSWGKPDFDISGFGSQLGHPGWAQIWYLDEENHQRITLYLNEKGYVKDILIDTTENN